MAFLIIPATLRDLSYITPNLRTEDRAEIDCQLDHWSQAPFLLDRSEKETSLVSHS